MQFVTNGIHTALVVVVVVVVLVVMVLMQLTREPVARHTHMKTGVRIAVVSVFLVGMKTTVVGNEK